MIPEWDMLREQHYKDLGFNGLKPAPRCVPSCIFYKKISSYVLLIDNKAVFAVLLVLPCPGTVSVMMLPGPDMHKYRRKILVAIRRVMEEYALLNGVNRFEATTLDEPIFRSFMRHCGFTIETILKKYNGGKDGVLWTHFPAEKN